MIRLRAFWRVVRAFSVAGLLVTTSGQVASYSQQQTSAADSEIRFIRVIELARGSPPIIEYRVSVRNQSGQAQRGLLGHGTVKVLVGDDQWFEFPVALQAGDKLVQPGDYHSERVLIPLIHVAGDDSEWLTIGQAEFTLDQDGRGMPLLPPVAETRGPVRDPGEVPSLLF